MALSLQAAPSPSTPRRHQPGGRTPEADEARAPLQAPVRLQRRPATRELSYVYNTAVAPDIRMGARRVAHSEGWTTFHRVSW
jgi:hypothetical protein